jgi:hypothetical protein
MRKFGLATHLSFHEEVAARSTLSFHEEVGARSTAEFS